MGDDVCTPIIFALAVLAPLLYIADPQCARPKLPSRAFRLTERCIESTQEHATSAEQQLYAASSKIDSSRARIAALIGSRQLDSIQVSMREVTKEKEKEKLQRGYNALLQTLNSVLDATRDYPPTKLRS